MKLPVRLAALLAIAAGALQVVQQYAIPMSSEAHVIIAFVLLVLVGVGVVPESAKALGRLIPLHWAAILTSVAGVLAAVQQLALNVPPAVHSGIAVVLILMAALGIVPAHVAGVKTALRK